MDRERAVELRRAGVLLLVGAALVVPAGLIVGPQDILADALDGLQWEFHDWGRVAGGTLAFGMVLQWAGAGFLADAFGSNRARYVAAAAAVIVGIGAVAVAVDSLGIHTLQAGWAEELHDAIAVGVPRAATMTLAAALVVLAGALWLGRVLPREVAAATAVAGAGSLIQAAFIDGGGFLLPSVTLGVVGIFALGVAAAAEMAAWDG
ncbi:MAG: hypothetical protein ACE5E8_12340 [Acidimicrobiia bacterium]